MFRRRSYVRGGGPRVVVNTAAFHARVRGSVPGLGGLKETKMFLPHPRVKVSIVGSLRDREVACSASDRQGSNFESYHSIYYCFGAALTSEYPALSEKYNSQIQQIFTNIAQKYQSTFDVLKKG